MPSYPDLNEDDLRQTYEFEAKIRGIKSDEVRARSILSKQIEQMDTDSQPSLAR